MSARRISLSILSLSTIGLASATEIDTPLDIALQKLTVLGVERVGINVTLGGTESKFYVFDTGSSPLVSAYTDGAAWWGSFHVVDATPSTSPITYQGTRLYFEEVSSTATVGGLTTGTGYLVAQAYKKEDKDSDGNWVENTQWKTDVDNGNPPPDQNTFYGTMGADLADPTHGFYGFIKQFTYGAGLSEGFIVHAAGVAPSITVGLNAANTARFGNFVALNTKSGGGYAQDSVNANYSVLDGNTEISLGTAVPTLFDTGEPHPTLTRGENLVIPDNLLTTDHHFLADGVTLKLTLSGLVWDLASDGTNVSVEGLNTDSGGGVNAAITFFDSYDIAYDTGHGTVGFSAVPEPSTWALALVGLSGLALLRRSRMGRDSAASR